MANAFLLLSWLALAPAAAAEIAVEVTRDGDVFLVDAKAEFEGTIARTWQVLTDYARYADYVPALTESRVISRKGHEVQVAQKGEAVLLFFSFPLDVRLAITEHPRERIVSRALAGSFREMHSTYSLEAGEGRIVLRYAGRLVPDFYVPPVVGTLALKRNIEAMFVALVEEMERRNRPAGPEK